MVERCDRIPIRLLSHSTRRLSVRYHRVGSARRKLFAGILVDCRHTTDKKVACFHITGVCTLGVPRVARKVKPKRSYYFEKHLGVDHCDQWQSAHETKQYILSRRWWTLSLICFCFWTESRHHRMLSLRTYVRCESSQDQPLCSRKLSAKV